MKDTKTSPKNGDIIVQENGELGVVIETICELDDDYVVVMTDGKQKKIKTRLVEVLSEPQIKLALKKLIEKEPI